MTASDERLPEWYAPLLGKGLAGALGIELVELTEARVVATMPVDDRTRQPFGILHGGASIALAETVASFGAVMRIDRERFVAVGQEINGNHLRGKTDGVVTATAVPVHVAAPARSGASTSPTSRVASSACHAAPWPSCQSGERDARAEQTGIDRNRETDRNRQEQTGTDEDTETQGSQGTATSKPSAFAVPCAPLCLCVLGFTCRLPLPLQ